MKNFPKFLLAAAMILALAACDKGGQPEPDPIDNTPFPEPIEVAFEEYSLDGSSSEWVKLVDMSEYEAYVPGKVLMIDSNEELREYIDGEDYPKVDFSNKTLLWAFGAWPIFDAWVRGVDLQQLSPLNFQLSIEVSATPVGAVSSWTTAIIINKISEKSSFELKTGGYYSEARSRSAGCVLLQTIQGKYN